MQYGCIGENLGHSFSAQIHSMLGDYDYRLVELSPEELPPWMMKKNFKGINVTIPYKEAVIPFLTSLDETAASIGAVNTILHENGRLTGYNTDFYGMKELIRQGNIPIEGRTAAILGTGGTSKTARAVCLHMGAAQVFRVSRTPREERDISYDDLYEKADTIQVIINTTPVGMFPRCKGTPVELSRFPSLEGVVDAVYNPLCTDLVLEARSLGIPAAAGLYMLVAQAAKASSLFLRDPSVVHKTAGIFDHMLRQKRNIVLIGMPGSGKTTIGSALGEILHRPFFDSDDEFVKEFQISIPAFFEKEGEEAFRIKESQIIERLSKETGGILATGGGVVTRPENLHALRRNGILIFLDRNLEQIMPTEDRPLGRSREALKARYQERYPLYCQGADLRIPADGSVDEVVHHILTALSLNAEMRKL